MVEEMCSRHNLYALVSVGEETVAGNVCGAHIALTGFSRKVGEPIDLIVTSRLPVQRRAVDWLWRAAGAQGTKTVGEPHKIVYFMDRWFRLGHIPTIAQALQCQHVVMHQLPADPKAMARAINMPDFPAR